MCVSKPKKPAPLPPPEPIEKKESDLQISAKSARDKKKKTSNKSAGLNRFLITPGNSGSGANIPE